MVCKGVSRSPALSIGLSSIADCHVRHIVETLACGGMSGRRPSNQWLCSACAWLPQHCKLSRPQPLQLMRMAHDLLLRPFCGGLHELWCNVP